MVKVTDYERITTVEMLELGRIFCPKCNATCSINSRSLNKRHEWDCPKCGRGWIQVPNDVQTVAQALDLE